MAYHYALMIKVATTREPVTFSKAAQDPQWIEAMKDEIQALNKKETWDLVDDFDVELDDEAMGWLLNHVDLSEFGWREKLCMRVKTIKLFNSDVSMVYQGAHHREHVYWPTKFYLHIDVISQGIWIVVYPISSKPDKSSYQSLLSC